MKGFVTLFAAEKLGVVKIYTGSEKMVVKILAKHK